MPMTDAPDRASDRRGEVYVLRVDILDRLMRAKGIRSVAAQARAAKISRSTLFRLRGDEDVPADRLAVGKPVPCASLPVAMRLAAAANTTVETLFAKRSAD